jgi:hypothetical protein
MERYIEDPNVSDQKRHASKVTLEKTEALINLLKSKITYEDQLLSDIRGLEEQPVSS